MDAPLRSGSSSGKWGTFLQEFAQHRETLPGGYARQRLARIENHITSIFRECQDNPQSQENLKLILAKFSQSNFAVSCSEISRKIAALSGKPTEPDQAPRFHPLPSQSINDYVSKWDTIVLNPNQFAQAFFETLLCYYKDLPPEQINDALSKLFQNMHAYFNVRTFSQVQDIHAHESLEFLDNLLKIRDMDNPELRDLVQLLVTHHKLGEGTHASALLWKKVEFTIPSIALLNALSRDIVIIGPLWAKDPTFNAKLYTLLKTFLREFETTSPQAVQAFAHLCSELNRVRPDSLPVDVRNFAVDKRVVEFKDKTVCTVRNYKFALFAKHTRSMEKFHNSAIDPKLFAKVLDNFYSYRSRDSLNFKELIEVLKFAQEVGNLDLRSIVASKFNEITDLTNDRDLESHFFKDYEGLLTIAGREHYNANAQYSPDSLLGIYQKFHRNQIEQFQSLQPKINGGVYLRYSKSLVRGPVFDSFASIVRSIQPVREDLSNELGYFYSLIQTTQVYNKIAEATNQPKNYDQVNHLLMNTLSSNSLTAESKDARLNLIKTSFPELTQQPRQEQPTLPTDEEDIVMTSENEWSNQDDSLGIALQFTEKNLNPDRFKNLLGFKIKSLWFKEETNATRQIAQMFYMAEVKYDVLAKPTFGDLWHNFTQSLSGKKP